LLLLFVILFFFALLLFDEFADFVPFLAFVFWDDVVPRDNREADPPPFEEATIMVLAAFPANVRIARFTLRGRSPP
jgi:hypothetical protein